MKTIREMFLGFCRDKNNIKHIYDEKTLMTFCGISLATQQTTPKTWKLTKIEWEHKGRKMSSRVLCPSCVTRFKQIEKQLNPEGESQFYNDDHYKRALPSMRKAKEPTTLS